MIRNRPQHFIDEIQFDLEILTGKKWFRSHIRREIRRLGYSCNKVFLRAAQINGIERLDYRLRLERMCINPEMLICIDATARLDKDGLRDHIWSRTGDSSGAVKYRFFFVPKK